MQEEYTFDVTYLYHGLFMLDFDRDCVELDLHLDLGLGNLLRSLVIGGSLSVSFLFSQSFLVTTSVIITAAIIVLSS